METYDSEVLADALRAVRSPFTPWECHGVICGRLSRGLFAEARDWAGELFPDERDLGEPLIADAVERLEQLRRHAEASLLRPEGDFTLLLPGDERSLAERAEALRDWCQGFLYGFAQGGEVDRETPSREEVEELLRDIERITRVDFEHAEGEEDEAAFFELVEYLRTGVMSLFCDWRLPGMEPAADEGQDGR
ncbi:MAG: YecA family protein [Gammaproteobacteria bacterium]|nr:MAG: YecA family protein [Gammaproteobacteria bacterium]